MLKHTAFHDNLYQLARIINITTEGLMLDLSEDMFLEKMATDISFTSKMLQSLFTEIQNLSHLPEYVSIMQCLYSCETNYLLLLQSFASKIVEKNFDLPVSAAEFTSYYKIHHDIKQQIEDCIQDAGKNSDSYRIVSKNELAQLLCV